MDEAKLMEFVHKAVGDVRRAARLLDGRHRRPAWTHRPSNVVDEVRL